MVSIVFRELIEGLETLFSFEEIRSRFHAIDPRIKMLYVISTIVVASLINSSIKLLILIIMNIVLVVLSRIPIERFFKVLRTLIIFILIVYALNIVFTVIFEGISIETFVIVSFSMLNTFLRLLLISISLMIFINTTTPRNLLQGLVSLGISYRYLYAIILFMRFIPIVFREILNIYDAQSSRGVDFEKAGFIERLKRLKTIIIPAFVCSMLRARDIMEALELRGFGYTKRRTFYKPLILRKMDIVFYISILSIYILVNFIPIAY